jgi:two-component system, OmpR family, osmolarity sensor histidine kinase EnvZ
MLPKTLQARMIWLFAATIVIVMVCTVLLMRSLASDNLPLEVGKLVYLSLSQADTRSDTHQSQTLVEQDALLMHSATPPIPAQRLPALIRNLSDVVRERAGGKTIVVSKARVDRQVHFDLWMQKSGSESPQWVGVRLQSSRERFGFAAPLWIALMLCAIFVLVRGLQHYVRQPLARITEQASALIAGQETDFQMRNHPAEIQTLSLALSQAARAQQRLHHERELMLVGISHDLRTPIARLRMALELDHNDPNGRQAMIDDLQEMDAIIAQVLASARTDQAEAWTEQSVVNTIEKTLARRDEPWALDVSKLAKQHFLLNLPWLSFNRVLANLLDNARLYGAQPFHVVLASDQADILLSVSNAGQLAKGLSHYVALNPEAGIRIDNDARSGLGLAIAARLCRRFNAELEWPSESLGRVTVRVRIRTSLVN